MTSWAPRAPFVSWRKEAGFHREGDSIFEKSAKDVHCTDILVLPCCVVTFIVRNFKLKLFTYVIVYLDDAEVDELAEGRAEVVVELCFTPPPSQKVRI